MNVEIGLKEAQEVIDIKSIESCMTKTVTVSHSTVAVPASGFGTAIEFRADDSITDLADIGRVEFYWETAVHAKRTSAAKISIVRQGKLEEVIQVRNGQAGVLTANGWVWLDLP